MIDADNLVQVDTPTGAMPAILNGPKPKRLLQPADGSSGANFAFGSWANALAIAPAANATAALVPVVCAKPRDFDLAPQIAEAGAVTCGT